MSFIRRPLRALAILAGSLVLVALGAVALLQVPAVSTWAAGRLAALVPLAPGHSIEIGRATGSWITGLRLHGVILRRGDTALAEVASLRADYDAAGLLDSPTRITSLEVDGARIAARRRNGGWDIAQAFRTSDDTAGGGAGVVVERLRLEDVALAVELRPDSMIRVRDLAVRGRNLTLGDPLLLALDTLHATLVPPGREMELRVAGRGALTRDALRLDTLRVRSSRSTVAARGVIPRSFDDPRRADQLDVSLHAVPLALGDVAAFVPTVAPEGDLRLEAGASAEGRLATVTLAARLDEAALRLTGKTLLGRDAPAVYRVDGRLDHVDPSRVLRAAPEGSLSGDVEVGLRGERLDSADGSASARLRHSRLAGTEVERLELGTTFARGLAALDLKGIVAGARVSARGSARPFDSLPSYDLTGLVRRVPGAEAVAAALAGPSGDPMLSVGFSLEGEGVDPGSATASGRIRLEAVRRSGERMPLGRVTLSLAGGRLDARPVLLMGGGRVSGRVRAALGDTLRYEVRDGRVEGVSLARLLEDTAAAPVSGRFALEGSGGSLGQAVASGWARLETLRYGRYFLEAPVARARLRAGRVRLDLVGALAGGTLAAGATARPFDSVVSFTLDSAALREVDLGRLLERPDLAGPATLRANARGRWGPGVRVVDGSATLDSTRLGRIEVAGATATARLLGERLAFEASLRSAAGSLELAGGASPLADVPSYRVEQGRVDSLDLGALLGRPGLATSLAGRFTADATGTAPDSMRARLRLDLRPSTVNEAAVGPGEAEVALNQGRLTGHLRVGGTDADLSVRLRGDLAGELRRLAADGTLRLERLARWTGTSDRDGRVEAGFALEATLDSLGLLGIGGTLSGVGGVGGVRVQQLHATLSPTPGAVVLDTLVVRSNVAALDGGGRVALRDTSANDTLRVMARTGDLNPLAELAGVDSLSVDSTRLSLVLAGGARRRRLAAEGQAYRLVYGSTLAEALQVDAVAVVDSAGLRGAEGEAGVEGLALAQVVVRRARLAGRYDSAFAAAGRAEFSEDVALDLALEGETRGDTTSVRLSRVRLMEGGREWALRRPAAIALRPGGFRVDDFALRTGSRLVALDGLLALRDTSDLTLRLDSLELDALEEAGLVPVPGRVDGTLRVHGPAAAPTMDGRLALTVHRGERHDLGRVEAELTWNRRGMLVDARAEPLEGGPLTVEGVLPWGFTLAPEDTTAAFAVVREPGDTIHLAVRADSFALSLFRPFIPDETAQRLRGVLATDGLIRGTPEAPEAEGRLDVARLGFRLPAINVDYEAGSLAGRLEGRVLRVDSLRLRTGDDGDLVARGEVRLEPLTNPALDLTAALTDFLVSNSSTLEARASGDLRLTGTLEAPDVRGTLRMGRTEFYTGGGPAGLAVEEVELTPEDRRELARNFGPAVLEAADGGGEFLDRFHLDLTLGLPGQVWFRRRQSPELDVEVTGRIRLLQERGDEMRFFGTVEPVPGRSRIDVYGRTFALTGGTITLDGPVERTDIDVTAEYQVPTQGGPDDAGVLIRVAATGRPDSIGLEFSSEPEMPQEDMISYVVTGRPSSDNTLLGGGGGGEGESLALGQLTEAISGVVGEELGFDVFQIRQDGTRGLVLTAGRYFSPYVFISLQQPLETGGQADERPGTGLGPGFELQYRMRPWLRASVQGGSLPTGLRFRGRYAY